MSRRSAASRARARRLAAGRAEQDRSRQRRSEQDVPAPAVASRSPGRAAGGGPRRSRGAASAGSGTRRGGSPGAVAATGRRPAASRWRTSEPSDPATAMALYRAETGYRWPIRASLAASLALLVAGAVARDLGTTLPDPVGAAGLGFMIVFISVAGAKHYRALYRMRRQQVWSNSRTFLLGMMGAPFGAGDPEATPRDRLLLRLIIALVVLLGVAELVAGLRR